MDYSNRKSAAGSEPENVLTVTDVNRHVKRNIESDPGLNDVWIKGEISNFTHHASGHMYFSLKDKNAQIRCVMFSRFAGTLREKPKAGAEVLAYGSVSVYEKRGEYQLYIRYMQPAGMGALFLEFEKLKKKLAAEGLFDSERKSEIPKFPKRIAVVTSPTGAAVRDVINVISRRYPAVEVTIAPAVVQGDAAPASIRAALAKAAQLPRLDTILIVRGGGSIEDLWGFNDESLARDIAACTVPIISGVGHETDFTIADFVSDLRAPTPSAAAEVSVPDLTELVAGLNNVENRLLRITKDSIRYFNTRIDTVSATVSYRRLLDEIDRKRQYLDDLMNVAKKQLVYDCRSLRERIESLGKQLNGLDPKRVLQRGYSVTRDARTGKIIRSVKSVKNGQLLNVSLGDGDILTRADLKANESQGALDFD